MRARTFLSGFAVVVAIALGATMLGCFEPREPGCAFSCGPIGACPAAYLCGADNLCHRTDGLGFCPFTPQDGGPDADPDAADAGAD